MSATANRLSHFERAALAAAVGVAGLALLRTLVQIVPTVWFDVDPVADPWPAGWGPAQSLALDALTLVLAGFVYAVCMPRARWADAAVAAAALVPATAIVLHGMHDADDAWRGTGWLASMVAAAALWTAVRMLPRGAALRAALVAVLIAAAGPLLLRCGMQLGFEHAATVADYKANRAAILAARGWALESPQALLFERRLLQLEATGWFGLSNVLSSLLAALALATAGLAAAGWRTLERGTTVLLAATSLGCTAVVAINGSRGAIGAAALGAAVAGAALWQWRRPGVGSVAAVAACGAAVAAVVARGAIGESWGERSLLFRWHYMQGALKAWLDDPWLGAGPAGFARAYLHTRPDRAPEEVLSAHSMWVDWVAALGAGALAWCAVICAWVWLAGRCGDSPIAPAARSGAMLAAPTSPGRRFLLVALAMVLGVCVAGALAEIRTLDVESIIARSVGTALALALVVAVVQALESPSRLASAGLLAAVVALAVHAQIEMTAWTAGSAGWVLAFIGVAAAAPSSMSGEAPARPQRARAASAVTGLAAVSCVVLSALTLAWQAVPAAMETRRMALAAAPLAALRSAREGERTVVPANARIEAARALADGEGILAPWADRPLRLAASLEQWAIAIGELPPAAPEFDALAQQSLAAAEGAVRRAPVQEVLGAAQFVALQAARSATPAVSRAALEAVVQWARMQVDGSPRSVGALVRLARALESLGYAAEARVAYRQALAADESFALDPIRQMSVADREDLARRAGVAGP